jgi:signal transduction histidine kinase
LPDIPLANTLDAALRSANTVRVMHESDAADADNGEDSGKERLRSLARRVEELTTDIGSVLHANTSILFMTQQTIDVALRALGPSPFAAEGTPTFEDIDQVSRAPAKHAAAAIQRLLDGLGERTDLLPPGTHDKLLGWIEQLIDPIAEISIPESRASTLRTIACHVEDVLDNLPARQVKREHLREARRAVREVERISVLSSLLQTRSAILQMDYTIRSFREFVTSDMRPSERPERLSLATLIESAHAQLVEYARTSAIEVRVRNQCPDAHILGVKRELVRAVANLMHNAIKYSWHREQQHKPWVGMHVHREAHELVIAIENWGVPIDAREIEDGIIFTLGYRGKWSMDRGRLGTGVGLTDSREVFEKHRGRLEVTSRPARTWGPDEHDDDDYYRQPFITKVTIRLPEAL